MYICAVYASLIHEDEFHVQKILIEKIMHFQSPIVLCVDISTNSFHNRVTEHRAFSEMPHRAACDAHYIWENNFLATLQTYYF